MLSIFLENWWNPVRTSLSPMPRRYFIPAFPLKFLYKLIKSSRNLLNLRVTRPKSLRRLGSMVYIMNQNIDIDIDRVKLACRQTPLSSTQLRRTQSVRHPLPDPVQNEAGGKCSGRGRNDRRETVLACSNWESARTSEGGRSTLQTTCLAGCFWTIDFYLPLFGSRNHVHAHPPWVGS